MASILIEVDPEQLGNFTVPKVAVIKADGLYLDGVRFPFAIADGSISVTPGMGGVNVISLDLFVERVEVEG